VRSSLLAAVTVVALALPLTPAGPVAAAEPGAGPTLPPAASDTAREKAEAALARAERLFAATPAAAARRADTADVRGRDATLVLRDLVAARSDLSPEDDARAAELLARPTVSADRDTGEYDRAEETPECGAVACVHWVATGSDAPKDLDGDGERRDTVQQVLEITEQVHARYTGARFAAPEGDGAAGGSPLVDVYLADLGSGAYGYAVPDPDDGGRPHHRSAYLVIDNDFSGFSRPWFDIARVTLAHEYFHAVQFAYDAFEAAWLLESTATWVEDELFDDVNDNRQYLPAGQVRRPWRPLDGDATYGRYGNWILFRYLSERWTGRDGDIPRIVRQVWEKAGSRGGDPDLYSTRAVRAVLADRGVSFADGYGDFAAANRHPARSYKEGTAREYRPARVSRDAKLGRAKRRSGRDAVRLDHLTHKVARFRTGDGLRRRDWRIRVWVDMARRRTAPLARLVITRPGGRVAHRTIRLDRRGDGARAVDFSSRRVARVELVLGNASLRGSRHDDRRARFGARAFRR
jgi:hypothetical protein